VYEIVNQNPSLEELSLGFDFRKKMSDNETNHGKAFTLLSKLKQQSRQLCCTNQRLMKLWGAEVIEIVLN